MNIIGTATIAKAKVKDISVWLTVSHEWCLEVQDHPQKQFHWGILILDLHHQSIFRIMLNERHVHQLRHRSVPWHCITANSQQQVNLVENLICSGARIMRVLLMINPAFEKPRSLNALDACGDNRHRAKLATIGHLEVWRLHQSSVIHFFCASFFGIHT